MNAVIDRLVQYPNRFQLTNISDGTVLGTFDLSPVTGTVSVVGTILNHDLFQSIADDLASRIKTEGGVVSNTTETFTMAGTRTNISSGETISVSFGKIAKIINDLKAVAFSGDKADIGLGNVDNTSDTDKPVSTATQEALDKKVDAVAGSSLMTDAEHNKLSGIADGAEVNVNADWNATSGDAVILNKPTIPNVPVQSVNSKTGAVVLTGSDIATSSADSETLDNKTIANMLHLGAYDTYTYADESYTITRQTGYLTLDGSKNWNLWSVLNSKYGAYYEENLSVYVSSGSNSSCMITAITNRLSITTEDALFMNNIGISYNNYSNIICIYLGDSYQTLDSIKQYLATNSIYIQYKLATSTTERVEKNHFARTGQPYIEEWKKSEADRSANLLNNDIITFDDNSCYNGILGSYLDKTFNAGTYTISYSGITKTSSQWNLITDSGYNEFYNLTQTSITFTIDTSFKFRFYCNANMNGAKFMLNEGTTALPYQPYEGEVVHGKTLSAYPTSQSASETYLSKADASSTYVAKSSLTSVPTENSTNPITSGGVYTAVAEANQSATEGLAKKLDKGDWREFNFTYTKNTNIPVSISPGLENGTYICQILARGTGDYSDRMTYYSLGVFGVYGTSNAFVDGMPSVFGNVYHLNAQIDGSTTTATVRGDLDSLQFGGGDYTSFIRFRKIADD